MSFIDDLRRRATGIFPSEGNAGDISGETAMDVNYDPNQTFTSPYFGQENRNPNSGLKEFQSVPYRIDPRTGKKVAADGSNATMQGSNQSGMPKMNAPDAVTGLGLSNEQSKRFFGLDLAGIRSQWKDKGGFEGLMANPAFTLGLGLMKSSATGQPMSQSLFDNAIKAGAISGQYADRIRDRKEAPVEATAQEIENTKQILRSMDIDEPNFFERVFGKVKGENKQAQFEEAAEMITNEMEIEMRKAQEANKSGKPLKFDTAYKKRIIKKLVKEGKITKKGGIPFITKGTLETKPDDTFKRAKGGPVAQGKEYIVGEEGAEMFVPQVDGNIIDNDDTKVVNMLLESNPQLKNVSRARAVKILKNRFPDYF
jgi:hypothetical protein